MQRIPPLRLSMKHVGTGLLRSVGRRTHPGRAPA
jgi:hypothetical protein